MGWTPGPGRSHDIQRDQFLLPYYLWLLGPGCIMQCMICFEIELFSYFLIFWLLWSMMIYDDLWTWAALWAAFSGARFCRRCFSEAPRLELWAWGFASRWDVSWTLPKVPRVPREVVSPSAENDESRVRDLVETVDQTWSNYISYQYIYIYYIIYTVYIYMCVCDRGAGGPSPFKFSEVGGKSPTWVSHWVCEHVHCHIFTNPLVDWLLH